MLERKDYKQLNNLLMEGKVTSAPVDAANGVVKYTINNESLRF